MKPLLCALTAAAFVSACAGVGSAQAPDTKAKVEPTETVTRLRLHAAPAPKPALKHQLLPELHELNPGNPIQGYLKCFSQQNDFFFGKQSVEDRDKWYDMPLKDLPVEKLRGYGGVALRNADDAARLDAPDWQALLKLKREDIEVLIPDLQQMRLLASALQIRLRGEIADRRFDDAIVTLKTMFALSRHTAEHPTAVGFLVGIAIETVAADGIGEMISQPACPNLFWALADLPQPFVDMRRAVQDLRLDFRKEFSQVDDKAPMTEAQVLKVVDRFQAMHDRMRLRGSKFLAPPVRDWFADRTQDEAYVAAARKRLTEHGSAEALVRRFSPLQIVFLDEKCRFVERRNEGLKGLLLPYWQIDLSLAEKTYARDSPLDRMESFTSFLKIRQAQARSEQRLAMLRCLEALRLHAAEHDGKLPAQLADTKLPLPVDPFTGNAFQYKLEGGAANLRPTPPQGQENNPYYNIGYEVTITK